MENINYWKAKNKSGKVFLCRGEKCIYNWILIKEVDDWRADHKSWFEFPTR